MYSVCTRFPYDPIWLLTAPQIPAAWVLALLPHTYAASLSKVFDNRSPRNYNKALDKDQTIDQAVSEFFISIILQNHGLTSR